MPEIRLWNPSNWANSSGSSNPKRKPWTLRQAEARKDQAERFVRDVIEDPDRADEIADMSAAEYAEERGKEVRDNPPRSRKMRRTTTTGPSNNPSSRGNPVAQALETTSKLADQNADLTRQIQALKTKNDALQDKLDSIEDIVECNDGECSPEDHLEDIGDIISGSDTGE